jgi:glycosyltransferase involved in cell wall biosynthesis
LGLGNFNGLLCGVVAVLERRKGHLTLLQSIVTLAQRGFINNQNFYLLIEGSGPLAKELFEFTKINKIDHLVRFVPSEAYIFDFISALDVMILPSISDEDFPNVVLEAMLLGTAIIASSVGGTSEQISSGESGLLVPPGDPEALADAILFYLNNGFVKDKLSSNAKVRFHQCFELDIAVRRYIDLYRTLFIV